MHQQKITKFSNDDGVSQIDGLTSASTLGTVYGVGAVPGETVQLFLDGSSTLLGTATAASDGSWSITSATVLTASTTHKLYAVGSVSSSYQFSNASSPFSVFVDTSATADDIELKAVPTTAAHTDYSWTNSGVSNYNLLADGYFSGLNWTARGRWNDIDNVSGVESSNANNRNGIYTATDNTRFTNSGPVSWSSGYVASNSAAWAGGNAIYPYDQGSFTITNFNYGSIAPRSSGNFYMAVNGSNYYAYDASTTGEQQAFFTEQNLQVDANSTYAIVFWAAPANTTNIPGIRTQVVTGNGVTYGTASLLDDSVPLSTTAGQWVKYSYTFNTGSNTSVTLKMYDTVFGLASSTTSALNGNEFGIDDVQMFKVATASSTGTLNSSVTYPGGGTDASDQLLVPAAISSGNSAIEGGAGDDIFSMSTTTYLSNANTDGFIDGGAGLDTLKLTGAGMTLDVPMMGGTNSKVNLQSVEVLDITGTGNNTLVLSLNDVLHLGAVNAFPTASGAASNVQLKIDGDAGDVVKLMDLVGSTDPGSWVADSASLSLGGQTYKVYNYAALKAQVLIDTDITVNFLGG